MARLAGLLFLSCLAAWLFTSRAGPVVHSTPALSLNFFDDAASPTVSSSSSVSASPYYPLAYTAPKEFPTSAFKSYYNDPTGTSEEPRPAITDVAHRTYYPDSLANPTMLPTGVPASEAVFPLPSGKPQPRIDYASQAKANITAILRNGTQPACRKCLDSLRVGQRLARKEPESVPRVLTELCEAFKFKSDAATCQSTYSASVLGSIYAQVLSYADFDSEQSTDGQYICYMVLGASISECPLPTPRELDDEFLDEWFGGREKRVAPELPETRTRRGPGEKTKDGSNLRVLHMSDIHVDPRYFVGGEAGCTNGQCCRYDSYNGTLVDTKTHPFVPGTLGASNTSRPASYWGDFHCDSPWPLVLAALGSVKSLNGGKEVDMTLFTGDMVTHDEADHVSRELVTYTQQAVFDLMRAYLGKGPVFSAIGNHDSAPSDAASQHSLPDGRGGQLSWDWNNVARLWEAEGWFSHSEAEQARSHYAGYSVNPRKGLRIITINTDFWYRGNVFNYIHSRDPDRSGSLRFLTEELFRAEAKGEKVWIVGHVLTGWDGSNPLDNPTNLFYHIVDRFSPNTIAHIFFGHTHEDQFNLFYGVGGGNNLTTPSTLTSNAKMVSFMAPSITPGSNVNPSLRIMEIDPETYQVMDWHQYYANVQDFTGRDPNPPVFRHLYSAREEYGNFSSLSSSSSSSSSSSPHLEEGGRWPDSSPLNATFWSSLTEEMELRSQLVQTFTVNQGRNSIHSPPCVTEECVRAKICYMRSGSASIGKLCPQGYGSVQSGG
ncbi:sphingomyelin phosphodiesterase [Violaceomyces palustris]|uniref:Sphingomyelin phosphodiesterase n=1 Tax=Violaceomyces palustris TaxID=1673888 RepID=A0ACD0NQ88_9BASI|nr:sphingomyelin phosphodiesterase [Violaceomyces palustris]